ncbi:hypothetical protein KUCAC02_004340, partial [Chaenocephalus aceratus]
PVEKHTDRHCRHSQAFLASLPPLRRDEFVLPTTPLQPLTSSQHVFLLFLENICLQQ